MLPRYQTEVILTGATLLLVAIGIYMVFSSSAVIGYLQYDGDTNYFLKKQMLGLLVGMVAFIILRRLDYHLVAAISPFLIMFCLGLLILVLFIGIGPAGYHIHRWLKLGPVFLQPSELSRLVLVLYLPHVLVKIRKREEGLANWRRLLPFLLLFGTIFLLISAEPDMSMAIVIMFIALITLFIGGVRLRYIASLLVFILPMAVYLVISEPYRFRRIFSFLDPWSKAGADGYQAVQSLISIGSGQFFGLGFCASRQKLFYLPEPHTDFIFSVLGEEVGFLGASLVVLLFLTIMVVAMRMAVKTRDPLGRLLTISMTLMICIPAIVNIGMVLGLLPVAGIPLPFLSYGGSSLAVSLSAMGILCNVAYQNSKAKIKELTVPGSPGWIGN